MKPCIVMQSDFGLCNGLVSSMHGVCKRVDPTLELFDLTHLIPAFDIEAASTFLDSTVSCWPEGTVFVSVVDPGVGTHRRACVARTANGYYIVTPDNGTLTKVLVHYGITEVREIDQSRHYYTGSEQVSIFHGRDLFSYCAAKLAAGLITFEEVGASYPVEEIVRHPLYPYDTGEGFARGVAFFSSEEGFGIVSTNIPNAEFSRTGIAFGDWVRVRLSLEKEVVFERVIQYHKAFGFVAVGEPILYPELDCCLGLALNQGNFCESFGILPKRIYELRIERGDR